MHFLNVEIVSARKILFLYHSLNEPGLISRVIYILRQEFIDPFSCATLEL